MKTKLRILAISLGIVYFLFGILKFFPSLSPAETIGIDTIQQLTFGVFAGKLAIVTLAILEVGIGTCLIIGKCNKYIIIAAIAHMVCTFLPFFFFPELAFGTEYFTPSLLGQYILKNIVLISALLVLYPVKETKEEPKGQLINQNV